MPLVTLHEAGQFVEQWRLSDRILVERWSLATVSVRSSSTSTNRRCEINGYEEMVPNMVVATNRLNTFFALRNNFDDASGFLVIGRSIVVLISARSPELSTTLS